MLCGDINLDGIISVTDLVITQRYLAGLTSLDSLQGVCMDVNHDGIVNALDLVLFKRHLLGIESIQQIEHGIFGLFDISGVLSMASDVVKWMIANPILLIPLFIFFLTGGAIGIVNRSSNR